ncbi:TraX family protein [Halomonas sp. H5]|uniref:TraX family protein n=1 Tax=Halomonas sp. H5 TaxID=3423910 RepID=UPI003D36E607
MTTAAFTPTQARSLPAWLPSVQATALGTMLLDHLCAWLITGPWPDLLRITLGRLALPMFAFMVAWHVLHTAQPLRYAHRILLIALIAQAPFMALHAQPLGNICFTLAAAAYLIAGLRRRDPWPLLLAAVLALVIIGHVEYGIVGLALVLACALAIRYPLAWLALLVWPLLQYGINLSAYSATIGVVLLLTLYVTQPALPRLPHWLTRAFYPAHLWAIYLLVLVLEGLA